MTIPLTTTHAKVLVAIKKKKLMWYSPPIKSVMNIRNPNKSCFFQHDHDHDTKEYHALINKIKKLVFMVYL